MGTLILTLQVLSWKVTHNHWISHLTINRHKQDSFFYNKGRLSHLFYHFGSIPHNKPHLYRLVFHILISTHFCSFLHILLHPRTLLINKSNLLLFSSSLQLLFQLQLMISLKLGSSFDLPHVKDDELLYFHSYQLKSFCLKQNSCLIMPQKYSCESRFMKIYHQDVSLLHFLDKHMFFSRCYHKQRKPLMTELEDSC